MPVLEILYAVTVFLSAFLLFQIQPIVAKMILPWFGGSSAVWSTCMVFFQTTLLAGYLYAHWLQGQFTARRRSLLHAVLLAASLAVLPIAANPAFKPVPGDSPSLRILGLLAATVGLPYFMVSTTSSLVQAWYARTHKGAVPYRLFALSNFASMLALISYPLVVEPSLATRVQAEIWSAGYLCFTLLCATTAWLSSRMGDAPAEIREDQEIAGAPGAWTRFEWVALAATASILLLAVTTFLTQDVAAIPFLWILPLTVYLLSFILCFETPWLYHRAVFFPLGAVALFTMGGRLIRTRWSLHMVPTIGIFTAALFVCAMVCHGELVSLRPRPRYLTTFYVMVSLGGALGGLFVGLIAPNFFNGYYEFPIGLALCAALMVLRMARKWRPALALVLCGYLILLGMGIRKSVLNYRVVERNFYGQLRIDDDGDPSEEDSNRRLIHGTINHGEQMLNEKYRRQPVTYFCPDTGIGRAMRARTLGVPARIGILGLGCGTLAAYGRPGDTIRIYEINPQVFELANSEFTYLRDTPAKVEVALGDGRLTLEREPSQQFDLLVMDAFSGDSVPVHLVTREAFATYFRHLKPGGRIVVNTTNRFLDLRPVIERAAASFGKLAILYDFKPDEDDFLCFAASWILVTDPSIRQTAPELVKAGQVLPPHPAFRMWTDDYSNMWGILR